jgi:hypothetical protein
VAVRASIQVVRAFVHLRQMLAANQDLARKIAALEGKVGKHDADLQAILNVLQKLLHPAGAGEPLYRVREAREVASAVSSACRRI